eukprot:gnl/TRDRNA2_/TRDRNA2_67798_c1_seq1.p1 gnl/TRDRNA2_/TRDRNA2_67798_c1~~gnl/TRDRNA2_/TRDRNA2_67798_c1_seq1.p1  ORF type:complete len:299 (-),score=34.83 gnl/TRDRNA2_/TRDRNA2_67798_c1_seq1:117-938(-)
MLKVVPVQVQSTSRQLDSAPRIYLTVQQPERHSIFVSACGQQSLLDACAVGSANAITSNTQEVLTAKHTFLDIAHNPVVEQRPRSAPPSLCAALPDTQANTAGVIKAMGLDDDSGFGSASSSYTCSPSRSSEESTRSNADFDVVVKALEPCQYNVDLYSERASRLQSECTSRCVGLRELLQVQLAGWNSAGSAAHARGACRPCIHENKFHHRQKAAPCCNGRLCGFCHERHDEMTKNKHKERRKFLKIWRKSTQAESDMHIPHHDAVLGDGSV